jgi:hypothetical protein
MRPPAGQSRRLGAVAKLDVGELQGRHARNLNRDRRTRPSSAARDAVLYAYAATGSDKNGCEE